MPTEAGIWLFHLLCPGFGASQPGRSREQDGVPDSFNLHVGSAELKAAPGGGWATLGDIIMYTKSLFWSLQGGAVSSSASRDVLGPAVTSGLAVGVSPPGRCQGWCLFQQHGLDPVLDYPLPTSGRGKSSPSARWCHLIPFLGEAGLCLCPCEQDLGKQHRLGASSLQAQQFPLWKREQSIPKSISKMSKSWMSRLGCGS